MLEQADLVAFVAATDLARARAFYEGTLGLHVEGQDGFACIVDANGTTVRITLVDHAVVAPYTVLGWAVPDIEAMADQLAGRGVRFSRFEGMGQDERGIWTAPDGTRVAWFSDPDGHLLSISQH